MTKLLSSAAPSKQPASDSRHVDVHGADVARRLIETGELDEGLVR